MLDKDQEQGQEQRAGAGAGAGAGAWEKAGHELEHCGSEARTLISV